MFVASLALAFTWQSAQASAAPTTLPVPAAPVLPVDDAVLAWDGWGMPTVKPIDTFVAPVPELAKTTKPLLIKVVIVDGTSRMGGDSTEPKRSLFSQFVAPAKRQIDHDLAQITEQSQGKVKFEVEKLEQVLKVYPGDDLVAIMSGLAGTRFNSGEYLADDKVFRGPYNQVWVIAPTFEDERITELPEPFVGTKALLIPVLGGNAYDFSLKIASITPSGEFQAAPPTEKWLGQRSSNVRLTVGTDGTDKVLKYEEGGLGRVGGATVFLGPSDKKQSFVTFEARTSNPDGLQITFSGSEGTSQAVELLCDPYTTPQTSASWQYFNGDGAWHKVTMPVKVGKVSAISFQPPQGARHRRKMTFGAVTWELKNLAFADSDSSGAAIPAPEPTATSPVAGARLISIATATHDNLLLLAADSNDDVRLNALLKLGANPVAADEPVFTKAAPNLDGWVSWAALQGLATLAKQGSPTALASITTFMSTGFNATKGAAALALAQVASEPKTATAIAPLIVNASLQTRLDAIKALSAIKSDRVNLFLTVLMNDTDPFVRLKAIQAATPNTENVCRKLLWYQVNDPSDMVRFAAAQSLLASSLPTFHAEGIKSMRDDSPRVRRLLLASAISGATVAESSRDLLRLAILDSSDDIKAMALEGFAKLPGQVVADEVKPAFASTDERVKAALKKLSQAKNIPIGVN